MENKAFIVFTRYPEEGKVKTRLIPILGPRGAAELQRRMAAFVIGRVRRVAGSRTRVVICHDGGDAGRMTQWLGPGFKYRSQGSGDLGARMGRAFEAAFREGMGQALLVGSDIPGLDEEILREAADALDACDLVLGPARDGGYYLMGLKRPVPALFAGIPWGSGDVLRRTLSLAEDRHLSIHLLPTLDDVDRPEDLPVWEREVRTAQRISVIIPTLDEEENLPACLDGLPKDDRLEVICSDGGSRDKTIAIARNRGITVLSGNRGRAAQMNRGAAAAGGGILLFLHADMRLPAGFDRHVRALMGQEDVIAGAFRLGLDDPARPFRIVEAAANLRTRWFGMPYGDQGIFLRRDTFRANGGFAEMAIMEDYDLMRRLRRKGRIALAPSAAVTSARRWQCLGIVKTTLINQVMISGYLLGVSPERLARLYRRGKK